MSSINPVRVTTTKRIEKVPTTNTLRNVTIENRMIELDKAVKMSFAMGKMLQRIPKENRKFAIPELLNVAKAHRQNGDSPLTYLCIEALVSGWDDWANVTRERVKGTQGGEVD